MKVVRPSDARGVTTRKGLKSKHSFSFGTYLDAAHMGFGPVLAINEDRLDPGAGYGGHAQANMEVLLLVLNGALRTQTSTEDTAVIRPGDVYRIRAGSGVRLMRDNASETDPVDVLQIWITPDEEGLEPECQLVTVSADDRAGRLAVLASGDGREGSVSVRRDVSVYGTVLQDSARVTHDLAPGRGAWVQVLRGNVAVDGTPISAGDGIAVTDAPGLHVTAHGEAEFLLIDAAV